MGKSGPAAGGTAARTGIENDQRPSDTAPTTIVQLGTAREPASQRGGSARRPAVPVADRSGEPTLSLRLRAWRPIRRGAFRGVADVTLLPFGLIILDVAVFVGRGAAWVNLPVKPTRARRADRWRNNHKPVYEPVAYWQHRATADAFSEAVITLIRQRDPEALLPDANARQPPAPVCGHRHPLLDFGAMR